MQTIVNKASHIVTWRLTNLSNGVYRVDEAQRLDKPPSIKGWHERILDDAFHDELLCALSIVGMTFSGVWFGVKAETEDITRVIAWQMEE